MRYPRVTGYPLLLDVLGRRVVVVGGGPVAARRVTSLEEAGADVHVVTPFACEDIWTLATAGRVTLHLREFELADLRDVWLVHTATGDGHVDDLVAESAEAQQLWCVRADDAARSSAWTPAVARVGDVVIARHFTRHPELNGTPVRVTGGYEWRWIKGGNTLRCYAITTGDGQVLAAQGFQLAPQSLPQTERIEIL